jgi:hypothetical protein
LTGRDYGCTLSDHKRNEYISQKQQNLYNTKEIEKNIFTG